MIDHASQNGKSHWQQQFFFSLSINFTPIAFLTSLLQAFNIILLFYLQRMLENHCWSAAPPAWNVQVETTLYFATLAKTVSYSWMTIGWCIIHVLWPQLYTTAENVGKKMRNNRWWEIIWINILWSRPQIFFNMLLQSASFLDTGYILFS